MPVEESFEDDDHPQCSAGSDYEHGYNDGIEWALTKDPSVAELRIEIESLKGSMRVLEEGYDRMKAERDAAIAAVNGAQPQALTVSEEERHAIEHARYKADKATDFRPDCCFDFDLVKDLIRALDRAYPLSRPQHSGDEIGAAPSAELLKHVDDALKEQE